MSTSKEYLRDDCGCCGVAVGVLGGEVFVFAISSSSCGDIRK